MNFRELDNDKWKEFIHSCPDVTFYHTPEWMELIKQSFPVQAYCFAIEEDNEIIAILPATISKKLFYKTLDSLPYSDYGGPLVRVASKKKTLLFLSEHIRKKCREEGIVYAKVTFCEKDSFNLFAKDAKAVDDNVGDVLIDLYLKTPEDIWNKEFNSQKGQRKYIKRFERDCFQTIEAENKLHLQWFYKLYCENLNFIKGTPFPYKFFENAWENLHPNRFVILLAENNGFRGGIGFFMYKERNAIYLNYAAIDRSLGTKYHIMDYMFWQAIKWAYQRNIRYVHMGTTPSDCNSSYYRQKIGFGGVFIPQYRLTIAYNYKLFKLIGKTISLWDSIRDELPAKIRCMIERR